jgi:hypothetical protein
MPRLAAGNVSADADSEFGEDLRDVAQPVGAYEQCFCAVSRGRSGFAADSSAIDDNDSTTLQ